jgi:hypothetical protein
VPRKPQVKRGRSGGLDQPARSLPNSVSSSRLKETNRAEARSTSPLRRTPTSSVINDSHTQRWLGLSSTPTARFQRYPHTSWWYLISEVIEVTTKTELVACCRSTLTSFVHCQRCNICRSAWLNIVAQVGLAVRYALLVLHPDGQAAYFHLTQTLSVFPPRTIQKARLPTGPSLRLGTPSGWLKAPQLAAQVVERAMDEAWSWSSRSTCLTWTAPQRRPMNDRMNITTTTSPTR